MGPLGKQILCALEDGCLKLMDSMSFSVVKEIQAHDNKIQCLSYNLQQTFLLSASTDHTCKMWDLETWDCVKTFKSDRPLNPASSRLPKNMCCWVVARTRCPSRPQPAGKGGSRRSSSIWR